MMDEEGLLDLGWESSKLNGKKEVVEGKEGIPLKRRQEQEISGYGFHG